MLINMDWLKEWVDVDVDAAALGEELTTAGLEVEAVSPVASKLDGLGWPGAAIRKRTSWPTQSMMPRLTFPLSGPLSQRS